MATADDYRLRADQCRHLAAAFTAHDDPAIDALIELAAEHEAKAVPVETGLPYEPMALREADLVFGTSQEHNDAKASSKHAQRDGPARPGRG